MSPRHLALIAGAVVILGGLVYLFVEVQSAPASGASSEDRGGVANRTANGDASNDTASPVAKRATPDRVGETDKAADAIAAQMKGTIRNDGDEPTGDGNAAANVELDHGDAMDEANKHYDRGDYEAASKQALRILDKDPTNVRMLRVVVSSACLMGDSDTAFKYNPSLPAKDQNDMARRCTNFGIALSTTGEAQAGSADPRIPARLTPLVKKQRAE